MYRQPAERPKQRLPMLDSLTVKTPCTASWSAMEGDDRVRFCFTCSKNVYDLSAMTEDEAEGFLTLHLDEQDACVRLFRRPDGRVLTSDCPRGASKRHGRRVAGAATVATCVIATVSAAAGNLHVPRAHRRPHSAARFEAPRAAVPPHVIDGAAPPPQPVETVAWGHEDSDGRDARDRRELRDPLSRTAARLFVGVPIGVEGSLPADAVLRSVEDRAPGLTACYEEALADHPKLQAVIVLHVTVSRYGNVTFARSARAVWWTTKLEDCFLRQLYLASFPKSPHGSVTFMLPIALRPPP